MRKIQISAIICTYNHADLLRKALKSLLQQTLDKNSYEIVVVNNASTDNTNEIVQWFQKSYPQHAIKLLHERQLGLSYARNTGFQNAGGKYVAFMDDDAMADKNWLKLALGYFENVKPIPLAIGGRYAPFYISPKPRWFKDKYEVRTWGEKPRFLHKGEGFSGSCMAWRKSVLEDLRGFDKNLGVVGDLLGLGEERALFSKLWDRDNSALFYYEPAFFVYHSVPSHKMTVFYCIKRVFAAGQTKFKENKRIMDKHRIRGIIGQLLIILKLCIKTLPQRKRYANWQNWVVEEWEPIFYKLGFLCEYLGLTISLRQRPRN